MATLQELIEQQSALEQQQAQLKTQMAEARKAAIEAMKASMLAQGITLADIGGKPGRGNGKAGAPRAAGAPRSSTPAPVKYRDDSGNTWSGRGKPPNWLTAAIAQGATRESFRVPSGG